MTIIAIISDIHANLSALQAVLLDIHKRKIRRIFCLGDLTGYGSQPVPARCEVVIKGNHDNAVALGETPVHFQEKAHNTLRQATDKLSINERKMLHELPTTYTLNLDNKKALMLHGGPEFPLDQYMYPDDEEDYQTTFDFMELIEVDVLFHGHTHIPYVRHQAGRVICNPGSVGDPRDNDERASYILFDMETLDTDSTPVTPKANITNRLVVRR
ncbi:MAG: metallophosphoesterase family protein [Candidatus Hodarchaeales archaeon]|jgi:putative phosphoesterase